MLKETLLFVIAVYICVCVCDCVFVCVCVIVYVDISWFKKGKESNCLFFDVTSLHRNRFSDRSTEDKLIFTNNFFKHTLSHSLRKGKFVLKYFILINLSPIDLSLNCWDRHKYVDIKTQSNRYVIQKDQGSAAAVFFYKPVADYPFLDNHYISHSRQWINNPQLSFIIFVNYKNIWAF